MNEQELREARRRKRSQPPPTPAVAPLPAPPAETPPPAIVHDNPISEIERDPDWTARQAQCVALRILGHTPQDIADALGIGKQVVINYLYLARKKARLTDLHDLLTHKAGALAVDNLIDGLEKGDKEYTLETLKGMGHFRGPAAGTGEGAGTLVALQVNVKLPDGVASAESIPMKGQIVGVPRTLAEPEAEEA